MTLIAITALALCGLGIALALRAALLPRIETAEHVDQVQGYGYIVGSGDAATANAAGLRALTIRLGRALTERYPDRLNEANVRRQLTGAGMYTTDPFGFIGACALGAVGVPLGTFVLGSAAGAGIPMLLIATVIAALLGIRGPTMTLERRSKARLAEIDRGMPELVDLLIVTVEAGKGFSAAMQLAGGRLSGPLGDELRLALQEQRMGLSTSESLTNMKTRAETPSMHSFVRAILQGEQLGVSIGQIMRHLATEMRQRRRAAAEERAQKAPIKMLFPLVFLIFPSLFVVLLYPAMARFSEAFG